MSPMSRPLPHVICDGYMAYEPLPCGCRLKEKRRACGHVIQEGEPGGEVVKAGPCWLCKPMRQREQARWPLEMRRHATHDKPEPKTGDPFAGF